MKYYSCAIAVAFFLTGCQKTSNETPQNNPYPDIVVGRVTDTGIKVENESIIKEAWQKKLATPGADIISVEVIRSVSTGDAKKEFYMLVAKTVKGSQLATILEQKGGKFFFDTNGGLVTSCRSKAGEHFSIKGISNDGSIRLYCDQCEECEKTESGL